MQIPRLLLPQITQITAKFHYAKPAFMWLPQINPKLDSLPNRIVGFSGHELKPHSPKLDSLLYIPSK